MSSIVLLDTSVYLNILHVPGCDQDRDEILNLFQWFIENGDYFLLPMATIWETGNHIADLRTGQRRREYAQKLLADVTNAINGDVPYRPTHFPDQKEFLLWLKDFPGRVMEQKSTKPGGEGLSLSDLSIIKEWERTRSQHTMTRVRVWSLDGDLQGYDTGQA